MTPSVSAGRALYLLEHPGVDPSVWDLTDEPTRDWWTAKAQPIADAVAAMVWGEGFDRGFYDPLAGSDRDASESLAKNPYRKAD